MGGDGGGRRGISGCMGEGEWGVKVRVDVKVMRSVVLGYLECMSMGMR